MFESKWNGVSCVRNDDFLNKIRRSIKKLQWILKCNLKSATIWKKSTFNWLITHRSWLLIKPYSNASLGRRKDSREKLSTKACGILISLSVTFMRRETFVSTFATNCLTRRTNQDFSWEGHRPLQWSGWGDTNPTKMFKIFQLTPPELP